MLSWLNLFPPFVAWLVGLVLFGGLLLVSPYHLWKKERDTVVRLTTKRLTVKVADMYRPKDDSLFLRLEVENDSGIPIQRCYGRLLTATSFVRGEGINKGKNFLAPVDGLPPGNHRYPWSWTNPSPVEETAPPDIPIYLYVAFQRRLGELLWFTPTETGPAYRVSVTGLTQLTIAVGSLSEADPFPATKVRMNLNLGPSHIELEDFEVLS